MSTLLFTLICIYVTLPLFELFFGHDEQYIYDRDLLIDMQKEGILYETVKPYPYPMLFPYNANYGLSYCLTYVYTSFSGFAVVTILFSEDSLLCYFLTYTCGRIELLHQDIRSLRHSPRKQKMSSLISLHNDIIEFSLKLEEFFAPILLVNFMIASFLICLVGFQLATVSDGLSYQTEELYR